MSASPSRTRQTCLNRLSRHPHRRRPARYGTKNWIPPPPPPPSPLQQNRQEPEQKPIDAVAAARFPELGRQEQDQEATGEIDES